MSDSIRFSTELAPSLPAVWRVADGDRISVDLICELLASNRPRIEEILNTGGGVLLRGFEMLRSARDFERAMMELTPDLRDYVGGTSPREVVEGKIMTATYVPPAWSIPLHQEMTYTENPPDRIAFFCEQPATLGGGYSTVGDMRIALAKIDPAIRTKFDRYGLQLRRILPSEQTLHLKPGVQKPWSEVFGTEDPATVESIVNAKGWKAEWLNQNTLQLCQDIVPAVSSHPVSGDSVWRNQVHVFHPACMMLWAKEDGRLEDHDAIAKAYVSNRDILDNVFYGNGEAVAEDDALEVYSVLRDLAHPIQLEKYDLLLLDNFIFAHGRTSFEGERRVLVALADE